MLKKCKSFFAVFFFNSINVFLPKRTNKLVRELKHTVLPNMNAWTTELSHVTAKCAATKKRNQERRMLDEARKSDKPVEIHDRILQLKNDIITFTKNWKKQHVSYSIAALYFF